MEYHRIHVGGHKFSVDDIEELVEMYTLKDGTKVQHTIYRSHDNNKLTIESSPTFTPITEDDGHTTHFLTKEEIKFTVEYGEPINV